MLKAIKKYIIVISLLLSVVMFSQCAYNTAPKGWLEPAEDAINQAWGGWTQVYFYNKSQPIYGELISLDDSNLYVLTDVDFLEIIPRGEIRKVQVTAYNALYGQLGAWTALGSVSTLSHGVVLVFSLPVWIIGGSSATGSQSRKPMVIYPSKDWEKLRIHARFPQGPPPDINKLGLKSKVLLDDD